MSTPPIAKIADLRKKIKTIFFFPKIYLLRTNKGDFEMEKDTHTIVIERDETGPVTVIMPAFNGFLNHSCDANSNFEDISAEEKTHCLYAVKDIGQREEITINYNSFEYDLEDEQIADCQCNSDNCLKIIKGYKYLSIEQRDQLKSTLRKDHKLITKFEKMENK